MFIPNSFEVKSSSLALEVYTPNKKKTQFVFSISESDSPKQSWYSL